MRIRTVQMKKWVISAALVAALLVCAGCAAGKAARTALKETGVVDAAGVFCGNVQIRYQEDSGVRVAQLEEAQAQSLYERLLACSKVKNFPDSFSPEARADVIITASGEGGEVVLYYCTQADILSYRMEKNDRKGNTVVTYESVCPGEDFGALLDELKAHSEPEATAFVPALHSMEEIKAQLNKAKLDVTTSQAVETQACPEGLAIEGTNCRIYSHDGLEAVPKEQLLLTALYASGTGAQSPYHILGVYTNDTYTLVQLAVVTASDLGLENDHPDEDGDATPDPAATPAPEDEEEKEIEAAASGPCAVLISKDAIDLNHWVIYLDTENVVKAIVIPSEWGLGEKRAQ